jgi:hypothetical protein
LYGANYSTLAKGATMKKRNQGGTDMLETKKLLGVYPPGSQHWVGDGFPVRNLFPSNGVHEEVSPFLMLDYAGPMDFPPSERPRGVGEHPHRGFETVTIVYHGNVAHRDSAGNQGVVGPGDVQWMTAASGVVHEEMHETEFSKRGGRFEMVQLWVNLPKAHKMSPPKYQTLAKDQIPVVELPDRAGQVRVIAGEFHGQKGPAKTFTPINLFDARLSGKAEFDLPIGWNAAVFVLHGEVQVSGRTLHDAELGVFTPEGSRIELEATQDSTLLILNGEPIREPIASRGPFVMNTQEELIQAMHDYRAGKMGRLV